MYTAIDKRSKKRYRPSRSENPLELLTKAILEEHTILNVLDDSLLKPRAPRLVEERGLSTQSSDAESHSIVATPTWEPRNGGGVTDSGSGECSRLLIDSVGNLRYVGESSPLSLLFVCRGFFQTTFGESKFTSDPARTHIVDKTSSVAAIASHLQLPPKSVCVELVDLFHENINSSLYIFDKTYLLEHIVNKVYDTPLAAKRSKYCLLYLIIALAMLFKENSFLAINTGRFRSSEYFDYGYNILRQTIENGKLWLTEAYYVVFFYFQTLCKRSTSWLCLGTAIRNAQALGLHRRSINAAFAKPEVSRHRRMLWRSLYVSDRACSILLGRPLQIIDWDWDDFENVDWADPKDNGALILIEASKVAKMNGKIVQNLYAGSSFDGSKAEDLATELRKWSNNLPHERRIEQITSNTLCSYALLYLHLALLYGICLLCKPFFLFVIHSSQDKKKVNSRNISYFNSCVKSAVLTVQLIGLFLENEYGNRRIELYVTINCCFMAALIVGITVARVRSSSLTLDYDAKYLTGTLSNANKILAFYGVSNSIAKRYHEITTLLIEASETVDYKQLDTSLGGDELGNVPEVDALSHIQQFQNGFGPPAISSQSPFLADDTLNAFLIDFGSQDLFYSAN